MQQVITIAMDSNPRRKQFVIIYLRSRANWVDLNSLGIP